MSESALRSEPVCINKRIPDPMCCALTDPFLPGGRVSPGVRAARQAWPLPKDVLVPGLGPERRGERVPHALSGSLPAVHRGRVPPLLLLPRRIEVTATRLSRKKKSCHLYFLEEFAKRMPTARSHRTGSEGCPAEADPGFAAARCVASPSSLRSELAKSERR